MVWDKVNRIHMFMFMLLTTMVNIVDKILVGPANKIDILSLIFFSRSNYLVDYGSSQTLNAGRDLFTSKQHSSLNIRYKECTTTAANHIVDVNVF